MAFAFDNPFNARRLGRARLANKTSRLGRWTGLDAIARLAAGMTTRTPGGRSGMEIRAFDDRFLRDAARAPGDIRPHHGRLN